MYNRRPCASPALQDAAAAFPYYLPNSSVAAADIITAAAAPPLGMLPATPASGIRSGSRRPRVSRKHERHSKICTAGGMRDRRMRLSMDVARRFFALQDKLCFEKASKTVQWLLDMSKAGIDDLTTAASMSEDGSMLLHDYNVDHLQSAMADSSDRNNKQQQIIQLKKKSTINGSTTKESRARARERARERTRERNCLRWPSSLLVNQQSQAPLPLLPPASEEEAAASCSYNVDEQFQDQPWELSGVVFARLHSTHG